jgi:RimJ/RimL family protein N-acetyltransferase
MPSILELMQMHVAALFAHDERGRIVSTNEHDPDVAPLLYLGRTVAGNLWRFHADLPDDLVQQLELVLQREPVAADLAELERTPTTLSELQKLLSSYRLIEDISSGPCWYFPEEIDLPNNVTEITPDNINLAQRYFEYTADHLRELQPCFAVVADGAAVAMCSTVRIPDRATEAGVYTEEPYRGRGYAAAVTAAWAIAIRESGLIPLYSTEWTNTASRHVAGKLGLILFGSDFSIS